MALYDRVAGLPLTVAGVDLARSERDTSSDFTRVTTTVALRGAGTVGRGEDVTYDAEDHDALHANPPTLPTGTFAFEEYAAALDDVALFPSLPERESARQYRRWAVESAALDLALRQVDTSLGRRWTGRTTRCGSSPARASARRASTAWRRCWTPTPT